MFVSSGRQWCIPFLLGVWDGIVGRAYNAGGWLIATIIPQVGIPSQVMEFGSLSCFIKTVWYFLVIAIFSNCQLLRELHFTASLLL